MGLLNFGRGENNKREKEFLEDVKEIKRRETLEPIKQGGVIIGYKPKQIKKSFTGIQRTGMKLGQQLGQFGQTPPQEDFSFQQEVLLETVSGGSRNRIWGNIGEPVRINNDLHPSISDLEDETASLFGFGGR